MQFDQEKQDLEDEGLERILQDIALADEPGQFCFPKRDNTIFVVDCSPDIMQTPSQGPSEFDKIMESYENFMMSKIIANCSDRVGLIFYNVGKKDNSLNFQGICTVHKLDVPSARMIKSVSKIKRDFVISYGHSRDTVSLHHVLWLFGQETKDCEPSKNHVRLFLFTPNDCPHSEGQMRDISINHARQLAAKGSHIELFPVRGKNRGQFDLRKFYQQIVTFDPDDLNKGVLDGSSKIMNLQTRVRQKQFKKRTLNRLLMQIGQETYIGVQIYALFSKAKKPASKKLQSSTNKPLQRVIKRFNQKGQVLFNHQIGTYYPLGGQRIILTKDDMNKIKGFRKPGITLIGFKPKRLIKPYHNLRPSYFLHPDEAHVVGSGQFFDALIEELIETDQVGIVSLLPRANQELRFAALFPQREEYDVQDHHQIPPGLHMVILPYADDIVNFTSQEKVTVKPGKVSPQMAKLTKLLVNNLTVSDFDFHNFQNPSLQKFYCHLQAHALNQQVIQEKKDTIMPDLQGMDKFDDIYKMIQETADAQVQQEMRQQFGRTKKDQNDKQKKQEEGDRQNTKKKGRSATKKQQAKQEQQNAQLVQKVQSYIEDGNAAALTSDQMVEFLKMKKLKCNGTKGELADRIMIYISFSS